MPDDEHADTVFRITQLLVAERQRQGLSQRELAKRANISRSGLRQLESGEYNTTMVSLLRVCAALRVELGKLLRRASVR